MEYNDQTLFLSDVATLQDVNYIIDGDTFTNCVVRGPAVVWLKDSGGEGGTIDIPQRNPAAVAIAAEENRRVVPVGVIYITNCVFNNCSWEGVTFMGPTAQVEALVTTFLAEA